MSAFLFSSMFYDNYIENFFHFFRVDHGQKIILINEGDYFILMIEFERKIKK